MINLTFSPATEPGSLDGFIVTCDACQAKTGRAVVGKRSIKSLGRELAMSHQTWHNGK